MPSLSDDFQIPIMYQDLRNPSVGIAPHFGMYTNLLGGVRMQGGLEQDKFVMQNRRKKDYNAMKAVGLAIVALGSALVLKNKGVGKWISTNWNSASNWVTNFWKGLKGKFTKSAPASGGNP